MLRITVCIHDFWRNSLSQHVRKWAACASPGMILPLRHCSTAKQINTWNTNLQSALLSLKIATRLQTESEFTLAWIIQSLKIAANHLLGGRGCSRIRGFDSNSCTITPGKSRALFMNVCVHEGAEEQGLQLMWTIITHMHARTNTHDKRVFFLRKLAGTVHRQTDGHTHPSQLLVFLLQLRLQLSQPLFHVAMALLGLQEATPA